MKKVCSTILLALYAILTHAQYYRIEVVDECTNTVIPNYWIGFQYTSPFGAGTYWNYTQPSTATWPNQPGYLYAATWTQVPSSQSTCGKVVTANGATIVSGNFSACSSGEDEYLFVKVRNPNYTSFRINGQAVSTSQATPTIMNWCNGESKPLMLNNDSWLPFKINQHNLTIYYAGGGIYKTTGWQSGAAAANIDLLQSQFFGSTPPAGNYMISLRNNFCGNVSQEYKAYINIGYPSTVSINGFTLNGVSQNGFFPPDIWLCNGNNALNVITNISGSPTKVDIKIETGNFDPFYVAWTTAEMVMVEYTGDQVGQFEDGLAEVALMDIDAVAHVLRHYSGNTKITVTVYGPCGEVKTYTQYFNVQYGHTISLVHFSLNGYSQGLPHVAVPIWLCNGSTTLNMHPLVNGTVTSYSVKVERGSFSGGTFINDPASPVGVTAGTYWGSVPSVLNLATFNSAISSYIAGYNGHIRLSLIVDGPCGVYSVESQIFNIQNASAAVDFLMVQQSCLNGTWAGVPAGVQPRNTSLSFPSFAQPVDTVDAPCHLGWLGAGTCGISGCSVLVSNVTYQGYTVKVDEVDAFGNFVTNIFTKTNATGTLPVAAGFNHSTYSAGYFQNNYDDIKNNKIFKVKVSVPTAGCGAVSDSSYFMIIDGGPDYGPWYKLAEEDEESFATGTGKLNVYPDPATNEVNFEWYTEDKDPIKGKLAITDMAGRMVLQQELAQVKGTNKYNLNVSNLVPGVYLYKIYIGERVENGKLLKQ